MTGDYLATIQTRLVKLQLISHLPFIIYIYPQSWTLACCPASIIGSVYIHFIFILIWAGLVMVGAGAFCIMSATTRKNKLN